ncbi:MAG: type II secretion system protein GspK [Thermodesulfovibrionales bacterium]|jgi:general secretion pathway protein K
MKRLPSQSGIALLLVLWVLAILTVLVLSFSFLARTETNATISFKTGIEKRYLAEAGLERGIMEVFYRLVNNNPSVIPEEGHEVWKVNGKTYTDTTGDGSYKVRVTDDSGKVDINALTDVNSGILRNLLKNAVGVQDEDTVNTIVDSILDWKDSSAKGLGAHRLNGAGDDYYKSLPNPYEAKHANFDTLEELVLVKGVTPEILFGDREKKGLIEFLAIKPNSRPGVLLINVNSAPEEVLEAIPGMTPELAAAILALRETKEIMSLGEIPALMQQPQMVSLYLNQNPGNGSNIFTIETLGYIDDENSGHTIKATIFLEGPSKFHYLFYKSPAKLLQ